MTSLAPAASVLPALGALSPPALARDAHICCRHPSDFLGFHQAPERCLC